MKNQESKLIQNKPKPFVKTKKAERVIYLSEIKNNEKRKIWENIKTKRPELAHALTNDQNVKALIQKFNAQPIITFQEYLELI